MQQMLTDINDNGQYRLDQDFDNNRDSANELFDSRTFALFLIGVASLYVFVMIC